MEWWRELRISARTMVRHRGATLVAILSIGLGIGASLSVFSFIDALLFRPLPFHQPERVVGVYTSGRDGALFYGPNSYPDYCDFRDRTRSLSGLAASSPMAVTMRGGGESERVFAELVSGNYFQTVGVNAMLGRTLVPDDDREDAPTATAVISHGYWKRKYGAETAIVGRTVQLNGHPFVVTGVAPPSFRGTLRGLIVDVWIPILQSSALMPPELRTTGWTKVRGTRTLLLLGRLGAGVPVSKARAEFWTIAGRLYQDHPDTWRDANGRARVVSILSESQFRIFPAARAPVVAFMTLLALVVLLVLLVACVNVANLMLAQSAARAGEMAMRLALGATRWQIVRQVLVESLLLSVGGGLVGLALSQWLTGALSAFRPPASVPVGVDASMDRMVLSVAVLLVIGTGILVGLAPAWSSSGLRPAAVLKGQAGSVRRRRRVRQTFVAAQVAAGVLLSATAGLVLRSLQQAERLDLGFDPRGVLILSVEPGSRYGSASKTREFYDRVMTTMATLPGVRSASLAQFVPLGVVSERQQVVVGDRQDRDGAPDVAYNIVTSEHFDTMRIPILRGRSFGPESRGGSPTVAIVNQTFAARYWPGRDPIGRRIRLERAPDWLEVIGVAGTGKYVTVNEEPTPYVYLPLGQHNVSSVVLHVRADGNPHVMARSIVARLGSIDRDVPIFDVRSLEDQVGVSIMPVRLAASVLGVMALLAMALAAVGVYGVAAFSVARRTREIGIRVALGATRLQVLRVVLREGVVVVMGGAAAGLVVSGVFARLARGLLFGVAPYDPVVLAATTFVLIVTGVVACYVPALRAARLHPALALRQE
ncbi:MAG TPA: ABC transporter permease [Vicinamibacterales bacterium]|jgi:predicted permease